MEQISEQTHHWPSAASDEVPHPGNGGGCTPPESGARELLDTLTSPANN